MQFQNSEYFKIYKPSDLTLGPIVADPNCPTRLLSNLIDVLLKPYQNLISKALLKTILIFFQNVPGKTNEIPCLKHMTLWDYIQIFPIDMV